MMRAAIYARYSTELQSDRSIDDQVTLCRAYAQRQGYEDIRVYSDAAKSGTSIHGRHGIRNLMADAVEGKFDVIVVEALDRLSRDIEDLAGIHKRLSFLGVKIVEVHGGEAHTLTVGMRGIFAQMFREDNANKVRRGLSGRVQQGLSGGGQAYGYRPDPMNKGKMLIQEDEAAIVRRVFEECAAGRSPRQIAHGLNADKIRPPRGSRWNASTINGSAQRGNGILHNPLYVGVRIWNRVTMIKDPDSGRRLSRPNPEKDWVRVEVPELRIVSDELWEIAQATRRPNRTPSEIGKTRRPRRLLSGLLRCGSCGAGMTTMGKDRSGRARIRCSASVESGVCPSPKTFYLDAVEELALRSLRDHLRKPEKLELYIRAYQNEMRKLAREWARDRQKLEAELQTTSKRISSLAMMVADEIVAVDDIRDEVAALKSKKAMLQEKLDNQPPEPKVVDIMPSAARAYEKALTSLYAAMDAGQVDPLGEDAAFMRQLIESITVYRNEGGDGVAIEVKGYLNALLAQPFDFEGVRSDGSGGGI